MSGPGESPLHLLLFSVGGVRFGVDLEQVSAMSAYGGEQGEDLFWFHEEMAYGEEPVPYGSPTVIAIRTGDERPYRVIIDSMEDIASFSLHRIRLLPALVEPLALRRGIWGVLPRDGDLVLLVDFRRLLQERTRQSKAREI